MVDNGTLSLKSWRPLKITKQKAETLDVYYTKKDGIVYLAQPHESHQGKQSYNFLENQEKIRKY